MTTQYESAATGNFTYSDLFLLSILPIIIQGIAVIYLWKIHRLIGRQMTFLLAGINGMLLWYDITIAYLILIAPARAAAQGIQETQVEAWGLFIGFIMPLTNAVLHLILQRRLAKSLDMTVGGSSSRSSRSRG